MPENKRELDWQDINQIIWDSAFEKPTAKELAQIERQLQEQKKKENR